MFLYLTHFRWILIPFQLCFESLNFRFNIEDLELKSCLDLGMLREGRCWKLTLLLTSGSGCGGGVMRLTIWEQLIQSSHDLVIRADCARSTSFGHLERLGKQIGREYEVQSDRAGGRLDKSSHPFRWN